MLDKYIRFYLSGGYYVLQITFNSAVAQHDTYITFGNQIPDKSTTLPAVALGNIHAVYPVSETPSSFNFILLLPTALAKAVLSKREAKGGFPKLTTWH